MKATWVMGGKCSQTLKKASCGNFSGNMAFYAVWSPTGKAEILPEQGLLDRLL